MDETMTTQDIDPADVDWKATAEYMQTVITDQAAELDAARATIAVQAAEAERLRAEIDRLNDELAALDAAPAPEGLR